MNGKLPREPVLPLSITGEMNSGFRMPIAMVVVTDMRKKSPPQCQWEVSNLIPMVCMTCWATSGNGRMVAGKAIVRDWFFEVGLLNTTQSI